MKIRLIAALIALIMLFCVMWFAYLKQPAVEPTATPTFPVSATPSVTPEPVTSTPTSTATATVVETPPTATAVASQSPTPTATAVAPTLTPTATPTATAVMRLHVVQPGESLCLIALATYEECVQWVTIWEANGRFDKPHLIYPEQELVIP